MTHDDIVSVLTTTEADSMEEVALKAERTLLTHCGSKVFYRGLIEISNICESDCLYCGIRRSNRDTNRYELDRTQILTAAQWCAEQGYGSLVLQSGERRDKRFTDGLTDVVREIKQVTRSDVLPDGLGITLSVGEQDKDTYGRLFDAGAHRYLLRIESSNPSVFSAIHPEDQTLDARVACLDSLKQVGFQVGTGVMIGLPGQTVEDLAADIIFFRDHDIDMVGMGPFVPNESTPMSKEPCVDVNERLRLSLMMIAATRLALKDVNIAATTALQTLDPTGREKGLRFGANVMMPLLTPVEVRNDYLLYPGKPCLDETAEQCRTCLEARINSVGRTIGYNEWGDSPHSKKHIQH